MTTKEKYIQTEKLLDTNNVSEELRNTLTDMIAETDKQYSNLRKSNYAAFLMLLLSKVYTAGANNNTQV